MSTRVQAMFAVLVVVACFGTASAQEDETERLAMATEVLDEIMDAADSSIPRSVMDGADGIAIFPSTIKAGFIFGGHRGKGIISARDPETGTWSSPAFLTLTGGSFGLQIGGQAVDLVLVVMNKRGLENLLRNEWKVGGDASAVVGPVGRSAEASTDIQLRAEILSYSRTRGVFAGVTLQGSTIRADRDANERFYGSRLESAEIVLEHKAAQPHDADLVSGLQQALTTYAQ
jgi:SH3 domain-containing YSC84-like protein 1